MIRKVLLILVPAFMLTSCQVNENNEGWTDLIGDNLDNWEQLNGKAEYRLADGAIEGVSVLDSPNSFLCTKEDYGDFILEFDVLVDPVMNSGVQIRSESKLSYMNGRVHGYQLELDPSDRAWSGGIYDEARRMWLYPLDRNPDGQKAFVNNEWNHFRVEAIGNSIKTWCNGVPCANLVDDMTAEGFIGLQVHSIGGDTSKTGKKVIWKNMRIMTSDLDKHLTPGDMNIPQNSYLVNALSKKEKEEGWELLFDGESAAGWRATGSDSFPEKGWLAEDGQLKRVDAGGDIITEDQYGDFELILDFRYVKGSNSGIKYFISGDYENDPHYNIGCEFQVVDRRAFPDVAGTSHSIGALYDLIAPESPRDNGPGKWNRARIVVQGRHVEHWLNNQMTLEYERRTGKWKEIVADSKFKDVPGFGEDAKGHILLQDHGSEIAYRTIKIREL
ncbi:MAG: DUF1080 domain-containing protein [Bacteroidales bacterium]|nr:DUF1080 domain-containing protein [Bacteroidales bacterium]